MRLHALAFAAVLLCSSIVSAQPAAEADRASPPVSVGAEAAIGPMGNIGAVRLSAPLAPKWGLDFTLGMIDGHGTPTRSGLEGASVAAQARYHWHGRRPGGSSGYWLFGPMVQGMTDRTLIIYPGSRRELLVEKRAVFTLQVGYGWDWLMRNGARFGVEAVTGGGEGPNPYIHAFFVWGKPRR